MQQEAVPASLRLQPASSTDRQLASCRQPLAGSFSLAAASAAAVSLADLPTRLLGASSLLPPASAATAPPPDSSQQPASQGQTCLSDSLTRASLSVSGDAAGVRESADRQADGGLLLAEEEEEERVVYRRDDD